MQDKTKTKNINSNLASLAKHLTDKMKIRSTSKKPQLLGLHGLCWIGAVQKYLKSIVIPKFVYDCLSDPIKNQQSTNDTV